MSELASSMPAAEVVNLGSFAFYTGMIGYTLDSVAPPGFVMLQTGGSIVNIADYPALFNVLGTRYGGDGITTFGLPNAEWYLAGPSATHALWSTFGEETHQLTLAEIPAHAHGVTDPTHTHPISREFHPVTGGNRALTGNITDDHSQDVLSATDAAATGIQIQNAGGGGAHNNLPPTHRVNVIVKT